MAFVRNDGVKGESSLILADPSGAHETHLATRRIGNDIGPFDLPSWAPDGRTITVSVADPASDGQEECLRPRRFRHVFFAGPLEELKRHSLASRRQRHAYRRSGKKRRSPANLLECGRQRGSTQDHR